MWAAVEPLAPAGASGPGKRGRPSACNRQMFFAIYYILGTGMQWKALPRCLGAASTVHDWFQQWTQAGVFKQPWTSGLVQLQAEGRLDWDWQGLDACQTKAPLGGEAVGPNPTDRGKGGVKRHADGQAQGLPIGVAVTGANVHEVTQVRAVLDSMPVLPPPAEDDFAPGFCADKGYDAEAIRRLLAQWGYRVHILSRGEEADKCRTPGYRARRWVVERTHAWFHQFRRLLIRWEKKVDNYEAFLHLACANTVWRRSLLFFG
ncbi:IS5 family transposase [Hymenobacter sp. PAMC 26628]|uniref:IS5 family transposase n=1 Tax=Hymenobacter sp. PAMC 26628 TaxID=1484118 RepID=UPI003FA61028